MMNVDELHIMIYSSRTNLIFIRGRAFDSQYTDIQCGRQAHDYWTTDDQKLAETDLIIGRRQVTASLWLLDDRWSEIGKDGSDCW